jgi:hypothetical protein
MKRLTLAVLLVTTYLAFQNCSKSNRQESPPANVQSGPDEVDLGGNGYDGKVFENIDPSKVCADGTNVKGAINLPKGSDTYFLIRSQCKDISPQALGPSEVEVVTPSQIVYQSEIYIDPNGAAGCAGKIVGGYCWYLGASARSCEQVCASRGGANAATITYAGTGGTNAQCNSVLTALGVPGTMTGDAGTCHAALGCGLLFGVRGRCVNAPTTTAAWYFIGNQRACACNN